MTTLDDTLTAIDTALGSCAQCSKSRDGSPSDDFCSEPCQRRWMRSRTTSPAAVLRRRDAWEPTPIAELFSEDQIRAYFAAARQMQDLATSMLPAVAEAAQRLSHTLRGFRSALLIMDDDPAGESPAQRALRLQRTRNTGPRSNPFPKRGIT